MGLAGCSLGELTVPSTEGDRDIQLSPENPFEVEFALALAGANNAIFELVVHRRETNVSEYQVVTPVHLQLQEGVRIHRLFPSMEENQLKEASAEIAIGVASELSPVPGPGLAVTLFEVITDVTSEMNRAPDHVTFEPTVDGTQIRYVVWLKSEDTVDNWAQPKTNIWYEFATMDDETVRRQDLSPLHWPACGNTNQTPTPTGPDNAITVQLVDSETEDQIPNGVVLLWPNRMGHGWGPKATDSNGLVSFENLGEVHSFEDSSDLEVAGVRAHAAGYTSTPRRDLSWRPSDGPLDITLEMEAENRDIERSILTVVVDDSDYPEIPSVTVEQNGDVVVTERINSRGRAQFSLEDGAEYTVSADGVSETRTVTVDGNTEITLGNSD